jgi:hypothetical protein
LQLSLSTSHLLRFVITFEAMSVAPNPSGFALLISAFGESSARSARLGSGLSCSPSTSSVSSNDNEAVTPKYEIANTDASRNLEDIALSPFLEAFDKLLRIFVIIGSAFLASQMQKEGRAKIAIIVAATKRHCEKKNHNERYADMTLRQLVDAEAAFSSGGSRYFGPAPVIPALRWITRVLHFIERLVFRLRNNARLCLHDTAQLAYCDTLRPSHNFLTRAIFDEALTYVPSRETFEAQIDCESTAVYQAYERFLDYVTPHVGVLLDAQKNTCYANDDKGWNALRTK